MNRSKRISIALLLLFICIAIIITTWFTSKEKQAHDAITHHTLTLHGKKYAYTTHAGTITLYDKEHNPTVRMFYTADTLDNTSPDTRPITFIYNGGPGSSAMLLRMASFGPKRVILNNYRAVPAPPYHMVDNEYSLLDKTDLVFVDMPGTGFGRLVGKSKSSDFYGVDKDVNAFSHFIQQYIQKNQRWNSPKFLYGESYGTTRSGILVNELQHQGIQINGVILQSAILNYSLMTERTGGGDWPFVLNLPSLAATTWHFHRSTYHPASLSNLLKEVERFAMTEYVEALAKGSTLSKKELYAVAKKLHRYLGISTQFIVHTNLRIPAGQFSGILMRKYNERLGRFDSRFALYALNKGKPSFETTPDAANLTIKSAVLAENDEYLKTTLGYKTSLPYLGNVKIYKDWDFTHGDQFVVNASYDLATAMVENPSLRVFSANGYYDLATPFFATMYTLQHLNLPPKLENHITYGFYSAGHMIYVDPVAIKQFRQDLGNWYDKVLYETRK